MASYDTLVKAKEHPDWIWPRSDTRVFLGEPGGPEGAKTTVEPGNSFSPGMASYGITWWLRYGDRLFSPEEAPLEELTWEFEEGWLPVIHCRTTVDCVNIHSELFQDGTCKDQSEAVTGRLRVTNTGTRERSMELFLVLRSAGPAGGPVRSIETGKDGQSLWMEKEKNPMIGVDVKPCAIGCGTGDPSADARKGIIPGAQRAEDENGWCYGIMQFSFSLKEKESWEVKLDCPIRSAGVVPDELPGLQTYAPEKFEERKRQHLAKWKEWFRNLDVDVPDKAFKEAFYANLQHMLTALVGDQIRLAPLAYPLPWMRDSVAIMRCFDLAGYHQLAESVSEICVRQDFFGGFCAEADSPGQAIWALVQHYRITKDTEWLKRVYPSIQRKCD